MRHDAVFKPVGKLDLLRSELAKDVNTLAALRISILSAIHNAPLNDIAQVGKAAEDDCKVTATLGSRRFQQTIDVFKKTETRLFHLEEVVDVPPKNALLSLNAPRLVKRSCHRIVLAWEASDDHIDIRNNTLASLGLLENLIDIFINY